MSWQRQNIILLKSQLRPFQLHSRHLPLARSAGSKGGVVLYSGGRQYTYWHMIPSRGIQQGRRVRAGQRIGTLANWGGNTHLHYSLHLTGNNYSPNARLDTNCVDPMQLARQGLF